MVPFILIHKKTIISTKQVKALRGLFNNQPHQGDKTRLGLKHKSFLFFYASLFLDETTKKYIITDLLIFI